MHTRVFHGAHIVGETPLISKGISDSAKDVREML